MDRNSKVAKRNGAPRTRVYKLSIPSSLLTAIRKNNRIGVRRGGGVYAKNEYKESLELIALLLKRQHDEEPFKGCNVSISWKRGKELAKIKVVVVEEQCPHELKVDVDAPETALLDCLEMAGIIENDKFVKSAKIEKE